MLVFEERGNRSTRRKPLGAEQRTNKLNPHMKPDVGIEPGPGAVSRKSRKLFGPEKPFVKLRPAYSVKLVFSYVVKGIKIIITAKFCASGRHRFEDTKRIMSPEMRPKSLGTFEKRAPGECSHHCAIPASRDDDVETSAFNANIRLLTDPIHSD